MREIAIPRFARSGFTHPLGKMSDRPIRNLRLPLSVEDELQRQAREIRIPFHEYLRDLLSARAFGADKIKRTYAERIDAIAGPEEEPNAKE